MDFDIADKPRSEITSVELVDFAQQKLATGVQPRGETRLSPCAERGN
jgi:hypothetical protein